MIDNEDYKTERKRRNRELVCRIKADAEKKYDKYWYEFQVTGNSSTERTARKYEELITVCELALSGIDEECGRCRMRRKNGVEIIKSLQQSKGLGEKTVGIDDVINYIDTVSAY